MDYSLKHSKEDNTFSFALWSAPSSGRVSTVQVPVVMRADIEQHTTQ